MFKIIKNCSYITSTNFNYSTYNVKHTLRSNVNPATSFLARNKFLYWGNKQPNTYLSNYGWYHFLSIRRSVCIATRCRPGRTLPRQIQWNREKRRSLFLWGKLTQPYMTARCLIALSNVVQSSFNLTPAQLSMLKDPIVTASNNHQHPLSARAEPGRTGNLCGTAIGQ